MQPPVALDARTARILPWLVAIAFFMQTLDGTILNTALPAMARDLAENPLRMQGVVIAYMLTVALLIPASGWIADRFGSRRIFVAAIVLFSLGSLLCALSTSFNQLVASRVLQALGGALMLPVGRLVVLRAFPRSEFVRIMAFIALPGLVGPLLGPTLGGWLVEYASWHWIFLINLPVGVIGCIAALRFMPDLKGPERVRFDTLGFVLFGAAMALLAGLATPAAWLGLALAAGALGFLPWNLPRARLFLGDVGSHALGYAVAALSLLALSGAPGIEPWQPLLLASAFLVDAGLTLLRRFARGEKVWQAHREHLYQRAIAHGASHGQVCLAYAAWTGVAIALAAWLVPMGTAVAWSVTLGWLISGIIWHVLGGRRWPPTDSRHGKEA